MRGTTRFWWIVGFIATTGLALLSAGNTVIWFTYRGEPIPWRSLVLLRVLDWYTCAIFFPLLVIAIRRWPIDRQHLPTRLPLHLGLTLVACVGKIALYHPIQRALLTSFDLPLQGVLAGNLISELMAFGAVIAVIHAIEFYLRYRDGEMVAVQLQARLSDAQLRALRAQLNPHFLFNALNAATMLVHRDPDAADRMLTRLGELLRHTLRADPAHETPLRDEMELLDRYLSIMLVRFSDRVRVVYDVAPDMLDAQVPSFILQPLVENAFEHGVASSPHAGRIHIRAARDGDRLLLAVEDNGSGAGREAIGHGVGLANTRSRLAELYGNAASLVLQTIQGGGTRAEIRLPLLPGHASASAEQPSPVAARANAPTVVSA